METARLLYHYYYIPDCKPQLGESDSKKTRRPQQGRRPSKEKENFGKKRKQQ